MPDQLFATRVPWDEIDAALIDLGWKVRELAERLGVTWHTVALWRRSGVAPMYAIAYLEQILLIMEIRDRLDQDVQVRG